MKRFFSVFLLACACLDHPASADNEDGFRTAPTRPPVEATVVIEDQQVLEECDPEKICIEGNLYNVGAKPAYRVKLQVQVGGGKYAKPRTSFFVPLEKTTLQPNERAGYSVSVKRKIPYKDKNGEAKIVEAGKYNVKLVPVWSHTNRVELTRPSRKK
jgi:hypothetical protein